MIDRKWVVTTLRRCEDCFLLFRTPTTSSEENQLFYQRAYSQGFTTDLPSLSALRDLMAVSFRGTEKDYGSIISILTGLGAVRASRVFDFGCSWGYGSWQMSQAGFDVTSFEISNPRAKFAADNLGVRLADVSAEPAGSYDFFFSSHVIEHVPDPKQLLLDGLRLLRRGGVFVALTPNGCVNHRRSAPALWSKLWGFVHPQLISEEWLAQAAGEHPWLVAATPVDPHTIRSWHSRSLVSGDLVGPELLCCVRKG